jgi:hypothetical protein
LISKDLAIPRFKNIVAWFKEEIPRQEHEPDKESKRNPVMKVRFSLDCVK